MSRTLVAAGVLIVVVLVAAAALYGVWSRSAGVVKAEDLGRVLVVAASPDDNGAIVGQIVMIADVTSTPAALEAVSPALQVTIPGTTYSALGDAYPFGGGAGTADALARARDEEPLPYVAISPEDLEAALEAVGTVSVTLPVEMSVFDGEDLYTFDKGEQTLSAGEFLAVLKGAPYLTMGERDKLDASLAAALAEVIAAAPEVLETADTDLGPEALARLRGAL
jgi:hypothetical protein